MRNKFLTIFLMTGLLNAQTQEQIRQAKEYIKKTGITESQARSMAKSQGYSDQQIDAAIEQEVADAINEAIAEAVELGVSEATAAAAIAAMIYVYAMGGSDQDAMDACRSIAGDAC